MRRFRGWEDVTRAAILKVFAAGGRWHWVYACRAPHLGICVLDPGTALLAVDRPAEGEVYLKLSAYQPTGCFLDIAPVFDPAATDLIGGRYHADDPKLS